MPMILSKFILPRVHRHLMASLSILAVSSQVARADPPISYPTRTIRLEVPFTPGGSTDLLARGLARHFSNIWKQTVIVENRPGAGGIIALRTALEAPRDGYTLIVHSDGMAIAPAIYAQLPFNVQDDFVPIAIIAKAANAVVVGENSSYKSLKELITAGRSTGKLSYASAGIGSAQQMQAAKFIDRSEIKDSVHVPFKGTPEALSAVMAGRVDFVFAPLSNAMPLIKAGKLRALAVSSQKRSDLLPDVPSVAETGFPDFSEEQWWGLFAPRDVPSEILQKIEAETRAALLEKDMLNLIAQISSTAGSAFGPDFEKIIDVNINNNTKTAKSAHIEAR